LPASKKVIYTFESQSLNDEEEDSDEGDINPKIKKNSPNDSKFVVLDPSPPTNKVYT
jgi:hypothetical protein